MTWIDKRDPTGHLLFRYDPERQLVSIRHRGHDYVIDLTPERPERLPERHRASVQFSEENAHDGTYQRRAQDLSR